MHGNDLILTASISEVLDKRKRMDAKIGEAMRLLAEACALERTATGAKYSTLESIFSGNETTEVDEMPTQNTKLVAIIRALDNTWHRPFTTLELAALQGLVDPEEHLELEGLSDSAWRERIGNAVPPPAAQAIAGVMGQTLLLAWSGETFMLNAMPIWVQPVAVALSLAGGTA